MDRKPPGMGPLAVFLDRQEMRPLLTDDDSLHRVCCSTMSRLGLLLVLLLAPACGDTGGADAGARDAGPADAGVEWPELSIASTVDPIDDQRAGPDALPADLSCLGTWSWPPAGPLQPLAMTINRLTGGPAAGLCVHAYLDDRIVASDTCQPTDPRTDAMGRVDLQAPGEGRFAIRMFPLDGPTDADSFDDVTAFHYRTTTPMDDIVTLARDFLNLIPIALGRTRVSGTGIVGTQLFDCTGARLSGARLRVARADGTYVEDGPGRTDPRAFYFDAAESPGRRQPWSHINGYAGFVNIPLLEPGETVFVEIWGRPRGETEPRVVACEVAQIVPDGQALVYIFRPLRVDGPACPGLR